MNSMPRGAYSSQQQQQMPKEKIPSGYKDYSINNFTPQQQQLFGELFPHVGKDSYLSRLALGDESTFAEAEAPALRQFSGLLGGLSSRFSGAGTGGRHSSGFQNSGSQAASDFAQELQANRLNLRRQAIMDLMGLSNQLLEQRPQERGLVQKPEKQSSGWGGLVGAGVGGVGGFFAGGVPGILAGAKLGYDVGSEF